MKKIIFLLLLVFSVSGWVSANAEVSGKDSMIYAPADWFNMDLEKDGIPGTGINRARNELLKNKKSRRVIVAILDTGLDFTHEDLRGTIWTNEDEVPGNGIDDDNNGYIDDIHGWNFLVKNDTQGKNVSSKADFPGDDESIPAVVSKTVSNESASASPAMASSSERYYGNGLVAGPGLSHGTHVSGIIGARRNTMGINGIADNIEIMMVRIVPDGHEKDRDVANAIFYAVNNGAKIINMSFGKSYSPEKEYVDQAVRYAENHGVLLVHAAGNYSENNDETLFFPCRKYKSGDDCKTWIEVGASTWKKGSYLTANFSNYGKNTVDIFAPGVDIRSTYPGQQYRKLNGTSMAAPMVSGIAALILSYYPDLSAAQVKSIILQTATNLSEERVFLPGDTSRKVRFSELCRTGGIVNGYQALKKADELSRNKPSSIVSLN